MNNPPASPRFAWLPIDKLVVDHRYQRDISAKGRRTIKRIAENFSWKKFAPLIVADPAPDKRYPVIDGQHRTKAAEQAGKTQVPSWIVDAPTIEEQAAIFAAINGQVTALTPMQIYHARVASGDPDAALCASICAEAGVTVMRYPVQAVDLKPGQTLAAGAIQRAAKQYDRETVLHALQCITQTGGGNPGQLRAPVISALCEVLHAHPHWRDFKDRLFEAMDDFGFEERWDQMAYGRGRDLASRRRRHDA